jgi:hypothetical protein
VLPTDELCSDGLDNDCDGTIDTADTHCATTVPPSAGCGYSAHSGGHLSGERSERQDVGPLGHVEQLGRSCEGHAIDEIVFANLATLGTGNSDENGDLVLQ